MAEDLESISSPDTEIIDHVVKKVLSNYTIDEEILSQWLTELADVVNDPPHLVSAIQNTVIILLPLENRYFEKSHQVEWSKCISMLNKLDTEVYGDFKQVMYELLVQAIRSYTARLQLHSIGVTDMLIADYLGNLDDAYLQQKTVLLSMMIEVGCSVKNLKALLAPLLLSSAKFKASHKAVLLDLLTFIAREFPSHFSSLTFNSFRNKNLLLPLVRDFESKGFTILSWFKVEIPIPNEEMDEFTVIPLFLLDSSSNASTSIRIQLLNYTQFMVEVIDTSTGSRMQFSFNQHLDLLSSANQGFTMFTLTFDSLHNINLFINGQKSESIPCSSLTKKISTWNKLYIGVPSSDEYPAHKIRDELRIKDLIVLDCPMNEQWVLTLYALGVSFNWNLKNLEDEVIPDLFNHLNPSYLADLGVQFNSLSTESISRSKFLRRQAGYHLKHSSYSEVFEKPEIIRLLIGLKFSKSNVLFDSNDPSLIDHVQKLKSIECIAHSPESLNGGLYCLGGASFLLALIESISSDINLESSQRDELTFKAVEFTLECLKNSWRIYKEFEKNDGFCILTLLLKQYKQQFNRRLAFEGSLLEVFESFSGFSIQNRDGFIKDSLAFKYLVLDFQLYDGSVDQELLKDSIVEMVRSTNHKSHNLRVLSKLKLLRRLVHYMEFKLLNRLATDKEIDDFTAILSAILRTDISLDTIRSFSYFIIFALYRNEENGLTSRKIGFAALESLSRQLCDPGSSTKQLKKFSRALTIHWLLLLLSTKSADDEQEAKAFDKKIVYHGLILLIRLLRILGPRILKRFFHNSRGLDVLTNTLKSWWSDDKIISLIFLASFGLDGLCENYTTSTLPQYLELDKVRVIKKLVAPEFMLLLNNMALSAVYDLSVRQGKVLSVPNSPLRSQRKKLQEDEQFAITFNAIHLINQYIEVIKIGFRDSPALASHFTSKDWLEGIIELQGHLKLSIEWPNSTFTKSFKSSLENLTTALSEIFISKLAEVRQIFNILEAVNESTLKMILDSIFPRIFRHFNQFFLTSDIIQREESYLDGMSELLLFYFEHFIDLNYYASDQDMDTFINAALNVLESNQVSKRRQSSQQRLKLITGQMMVFKLSKLPYHFSDASDSTVEDERKEQLDEVVKFLLYKQIIFLDEEVLNNTLLAQVFEMLMVLFTKLKPSKQTEIGEHFINFLRAAYIMREGTFSSVIDQLTSASDYTNSGDLIQQFLDILVSRNDEDIIKHIQRYPAIKHIFAKNLHFRMSKLKDVGKISVLEMIRVMLNNGGRLGYMDTVYIKTFERDCEKLRVKIINEELTNHLRELQDIDDNNKYYSTSFSAMRSEVARLFFEELILEQSYMLDYIEGTDRMRKLLVIENQLADSDKLSYSIDIPVKKMKTVEMNTSDFESYEYAISQANVGELSLVDAPEEDFEEIEAPSENNGTETTEFDDRNRRVLRSLFLGDHIQNVWNISRINGLEIIESLMILGNTHLYLIENYFHCEEGNVIEATDAPLELRDPYLQLINDQSALTNSTKAKPHRTKSWSIESLSSITKRKFLLRDIALEMFFSDGASILITCLSTKVRNVIHSKLQPYASGRGLDKELAITLEQSSHMSHSNSRSSNTSLTSRLTSAFTHNFNATGSGIASATKKWQQGEMSNFYYLMIVNTLAGRTFNDLTQYPVFPWVLADYDSEEIDLSDPRVYRDLAKPMGAQTPSRAQQFAERYEALESLDDPRSPPFHYGTHYSSAMIVSSYMIRLKPYVQSYLLLQGGKFDHSDRLFYSIQKAWLSASQDNTTDVRELTPEFFYLPDFLENQNNFEFGILQNGKVVNDVELPKWAKGDPKIFVSRNREALESPYVSANLHKWIDLIFGYKQTGEEAVESLNVFHHLSYDGAVNLDDVVDDVERRAVIGMINNFGQTPIRIFNKPHAKREVLNNPDLYLQVLTQGTHANTTFESKLNMPIEKLEISGKTKKWIGRPSCVSSEDELLIRKPLLHILKVGSGLLIINTSLFMNLHLSNITALVQLSGKVFVTGAQDGVILVWKYFAKSLPTVRFQYILRGHESEIRTIKYSKTFKVGVSLDEEENVIMWDFTRFMFVRKLRSSSNKKSASPIHIAISNDTGNITIASSSRYANIVDIYTINGSLIMQKQLEPGKITAVAFASLNGTQVSSNDVRHAYWNHEIVAVAYETPKKMLQFYELDCDSNGWKLQILQSVRLEEQVSGAVTALEVFKRVEIDKHDKLCRGLLAAVLGDSQGKVYVIAEA